MADARDLVSKRVVIGMPEERLIHVAGRMRMQGAEYCVVLDRPAGRLIGLIRFYEAAARTNAGSRILADLTSDELPYPIMEDLPATIVAGLFEERQLREAVVVAKSGNYYGLITSESLLMWMHGERHAALRQLESLIDERQRLNDLLEKKVEQRGAELKSALDEFKAASLALSHDITSPLRTICTHAEALAGGGHGALDPDGVFKAQGIRRAALKLELMAEEVLDRAQRAFASSSPALEAIDLNEVLDDAIEFHRALLQERRAVINKRNQLHFVAGKYVPLLQIVSNLVANAVKSVPEDNQPLVEIWSEETPESVRICVKDNGGVIEEERRPLIFEPFLHGGGMERTRVGLGLAIARRAARHIGGAIVLEPQTSPMGSVFSVTLAKPPAVTT